MGTFENPAKYPIIFQTAICINTLMLDYYSRMPTRLTGYIYTLETVACIDNVKRCPTNRILLILLAAPRANFELWKT